MADIMKVSLVDLDFGDGVEYHIFDGGGEITIDGQLYTGFGLTSEILPEQETSEPTPKSLRIALNGVSGELLAIAIQDSFQNASIRIRVATLDHDDLVLRYLFTLFNGYISHIEVSHDYSSQIGTLVVNCYTELSNQNLSAALRYTNESQLRIDPNDTIFSRLPTLANKEILWGRGNIRGN